MLPCLAVLGWTFAANAQRDKEEARRAAHTFAALIARRVDQQIADARHLLETIARSSKVRTLRHDLCESILPDCPLPNCAQSATINAAGETICSARPEPPGHSYEVRDWFREAMSGRFAIGRARVGQVSGRWLQPLGAPILGDTGQLAGVALLAIDLVSFGSVLEMGGENGVRASLLDLDGTMLARSTDPRNLLCSTFPELELTKRALEGPSSSFEAMDSSGNLRIYGVAPAAGGLWRVTVSFSEEQGRAHFRRSRTRAAALGVLVRRAGAAPPCLA